MTLINILMFALGFLAGVGASLAYGSYVLRKTQREIANALKGSAKPVDKRKDEKVQKEAYDKVKPRLDRAAAITQQQAELMSQIDMPSKNSLHSKFKNGLVAEARKLEKEKTELLRSIIADGFDPEITVQTAQGLQRMHLSEYLVSQGYDVLPPAGATPPPPPTTDGEGPKTEGSAEEPAVRKVGNFFVIKGGKDETNH